jgi:hypothetical protein
MSHPKETIAVTKLIKFLPVQLLYDIDGDLNSLFVVDKPVGAMIKVKQCIKNTYRGKEFVGDLTGTAICEMLEAIRTNSDCKVLGYLDRFEGNFHLSRDYVEEELDDISTLVDDNGNNTIEYYLRLCNLYEACKTGHLYRYKQIDDYSWMTPTNVSAVLTNLDRVALGSNFRRMFAREVTGNKGKIVVIGELGTSMLVGDDKQVIEIKCTNELSQDHKLQLVFYAWILEGLVQDWGGIEFLLLNGLTGETLRLECRSCIINKICQKIISHKL